MKMKCPYCEKELVIEDAVKEGFCNYCGKQFQVFQKEEEKGIRAQFYLQEHVVELFDKLPVDTVELDFCKEKYEDSFFFYKGGNEEIFQNILALYENLEDADVRFATLAELICDHALTKIKEAKFFRRAKLAYNYNQCVAVYLLPALLKCGGKKYGKMITDVMIEKWKKVNKNQSLEAGSFEEINQNFNTMFLGLRLPEHSKLRK